MSENIKGLLQHEKAANPTALGKIVSEKYVRIPLTQTHISNPIVPSPLLLLVCNVGPILRQNPAWVS